MKPASPDSRVFWWPERVLWIGPSDETHMHSHHAVELSLALDGAIDVRSDSGSAEFGCAGIAVAPEVSHQLVIHSPYIAMLYVEPNSPQGLALRARMGQRGLAALPPEIVAAARPALLDCLADNDMLAAERVCRAFLARLLPNELPRRAPDERIAEAKGLVIQTLDNQVSVREIASAVGLSESRFIHLFREQVGIPMRRYRLWMRLRSALVQVFSGGRLTEAAHRAGFADAAHFARTAKKAFGVAPSLYARDATLVLHPGAVEQPAQPL